MNNDYGKNKYDNIKYQIDIFDNSYDNKSKINELMKNIIPILKEIYKVDNVDKDPYISGLQEAWVKNIKVSVRTMDKNKISSLLFDINSYVNYYLSHKK